MRARPRRATIATLIPLTLLSAAWTGNVAGLTPASLSGPLQPPAPDADAPPAELADPAASPTAPPSPAATAPAPVQAPAGVTTPPATTSRDVTRRQARAIIATAETDGIPATALAAYQRAATIIDQTDAGCHLDWQLLAAIGRVESDHGATGGNSLTLTGVARPGIFGPVLDGTAGTSRIADTDRGEYDDDARADRAVGPMQFIPSTWALVGVDADGDGRRNPQDINDAALGAAVYLCSGTEDLGTTAGQRAAVLRYNHSPSYVATVLRLATAYRSGDYTSLPTSIGFSTLPVATALPPTGSTGIVATADHQGVAGHGAGDRDGTVADGDHRHGGHGHGHHGHGGRGGQVGAGSTGLGSGATATIADGAQGTPPSPQAGQPLHPGSGPTGGSSGGSTGTPPAATEDELTDLCATQIATAYPDATEEAVQQATELCVTRLTGSTLADARTAAPDLVASLADQVDGLVPPASSDPTPTEPPTTDPTPTTPTTPSDPAPSGSTPSDPAPSNSAPSGSASPDTAPAG